MSNFCLERENQEKKACQKSEIPILKSKTEFLKKSDVTKKKKTTESSEQIEDSLKSKIPVRIQSGKQQRKEIGTQTGGILTVKQKSTQNYIPSGRHQLRRSALGPRLVDFKTSQIPTRSRSMEVNIEVLHDNDKVSKMHWRATSQISLRIQPEVSKKSDQENLQVNSIHSSRSRIRRASSRLTGLRPVSPKIGLAHPTGPEQAQQDVPKDSFAYIFQKKKLQPVKSSSSGVLLVLVDK